ncbi:MAG: hypothetical protein HZA01_07250 [Nitrospinae bacterium]|nr:hypothetical protein [Nitrospinota bacterium]
MGEEKNGVTGETPEKKILQIVSEAITEKEIEVEKETVLKKEEAKAEPKAIPKKVTSRKSAAGPKERKKEAAEKKTYEKEAGFFAKLDLGGMLRKAAGAATGAAKKTADGTSEIFKKAYQVTESVVFKAAGVFEEGGEAIFSGAAKVSSVAGNLGKGAAGVCSAVAGGAASVVNGALCIVGIRKDELTPLQTKAGKIIYESRVVKKSEASLDKIAELQRVIQQMEALEKKKSEAPSAARKKAEAKPAPRRRPVVRRPAMA